jgi:hypothetical protein
VLCQQALQVPMNLLVDFLRRKGPNLAQAAERIIDVPRQDRFSVQLNKRPVPQWLSLSSIRLVGLSAVVLNPAWVRA